MLPSMPQLTFLLIVQQATGPESLGGHRGGGQSEMGAGPVSHPYLGHLLLLRVERCQVHWEGDTHTVHKERSGK